MPQGMILGPILFLIHINDISGCVKSKVKIFVDETKIYREIKDPITDTAALQSDLHSLTCSGWAATWQMTFNAVKYESTRIMHSHDNTSPNFTLGGKSLKTAQSVKDLGVTKCTSSNLLWNKHVGITTNKANKVLELSRELLARQIGILIFSILYKSLVSIQTRLKPRLRRNVQRR